MFDIKSATFKSNCDIKRISIIFVTLLMFSVLLSVLLPDSWIEHSEVFRTIMELIRIYIAISSFFMVWFTYYKNNFTSCIIIGFGFLSVAVFNIFYTCYYPGMQLLSDTYNDFLLKYWLLSRFSDIVLILITILPILKYKTSKWVIAIIVLILSLGISFSISYMLDLLSAQIGGQGITAHKILADFLLILILIINFYIIMNNKPSFQEGIKDIIDSEYIALSIFFFNTCRNIIYDI